MWWVSINEDTGLEWERLDSCKKKNGQKTLAVKRRLELLTGKSLAILFPTSLQFSSQKSLILLSRFNQNCQGNFRFSYAKVRSFTVLFIAHR